MLHTRADEWLATGTHRLRFLLNEGVQQARQRGRPLLVSAVLPVSSADPFAFFARGAGVAPERIVWSSRNRSCTLAGIGAAPSTDVEPELASLSDAAERLLRDDEHERTPRPKVEIATAEDVPLAEKWKGAVAAAARDLDGLGLDKVVLARARRVRGTGSF